MNYDVKKLYMGLVKHYKNKELILELHALYDDMNSEELIDLNLEKPILPYGEEDFYYKKSLISFPEILMRSKINYGHLNKEDALKIAKYYEGYYFKLMRCNNINTIEDLEQRESQKRKRQR